MKIRYSDGMKYLGVWPLVGVVPLSHGHYREMWWTPKQKGSVRKGRKERSFGHFHIMSFHFCVCLFKALFSDSRINKYVRIVQYTIVQYNTLQYIKLRYSIEAPNKYLYCTTLFCTVLYKKRRLKEENEKICPKEQTSVSKTEVHSIPLWILSGYTRELANFIILTNFNNLLTIFTLKFRLMCSLIGRNWRLFP